MALQKNFLIGSLSAIATVPIVVGRTAPVEAQAAVTTPQFTEARATVGRAEYANRVDGFHSP